MTDADLIRRVQAFEKVPYDACRQFRMDSRYDDLLSTARCCLIDVARKWGDKPDEGFQFYAYQACRYAAMYYLSHLSHVIHIPAPRKDREEHPLAAEARRCGSLDAPMSPTADRSNCESDSDSFMEILVDSGPSPAEQAASADDIRHMLRIVSKALENKTDTHNRRAYKPRKGVAA